MTREEFLKAFKEKDYIERCANDNANYWGKEDIALWAFSVLEKEHQEEVAPVLDACSKYFSALKLPSHCVSLHETNRMGEEAMLALANYHSRIQSGSEKNGGGL